MLEHSIYEHETQNYSLFIEITLEESYWCIFIVMFEHSICEHETQNYSLFVEITLEEPYWCIFIVEVHNMSLSQHGMKM